MISVRGQPLEIDVREELEVFPWINATWTDTRLLAANPMYYDRKPAFYVILDEDSEAYGCWGDSGADEPEFQRGGFVRLLNFLRDETYEETCDYLATKYGDVPIDTVDITLKLPRLTLDKPHITRIDSATLDRYKFRHPYLERRCISEAVQRLMRVGYDRNRQAVTLPWFNPDGSLGNIKRRRVDSKAFWYESGARPIREMLYAIDVIYKQRIKRAVIVEAEIDALTFMSAGIPAIATGGAAFTAEKRDLILRSPIETLLIVRDNDTAGRAWRNRIMAEMSGKINVEIALVPRGFKDPNEWACAGGDIRHIHTRKCRRMTVNIR